MMISIPFDPLVIGPPLSFRLSNCRLHRRGNAPAISGRLRNGTGTKTAPVRRQQPRPPNLSVLRFTLGIRGFDESLLPRWIGYAFGVLIILNHLLGSDLAATPALLRTEALGLSLAAFSTVLPYLGKFIEGTVPGDQSTLPEGMEQIFVISQNVSETQKEDLAWSTYILLRNTNAVAVLVTIDGALCVRGYWRVPDVSKSEMLVWFQRKIANSAFSDLKETLYFPQCSDTGLWEILPNGTRSLFVQPVQQSKSAQGEETKLGLLMLASCMSYAFSDRDQAWIQAVIKKFKGGPVSGDSCFFRSYSSGNF